MQQRKGKNKSKKHIATSSESDERTMRGKTRYARDADAEVGLSHQIDSDEDLLNSSDEGEEEDEDENASDRRENGRIISHPNNNTSNNKEDQNPR